MTTPGQARSTVMIGLAGTGALVTMASVITGGGPRLTILIGVGVAGTLLMIVAEYAPELAASFAALILVTALFTSGGAVAAALTRYLGR